MFTVVLFFQCSLRVKAHHFNPVDVPVLGGCIDIDLIYVAVVTVNG